MAGTLGVDVGATLRIANVTPTTVTGPVTGGGTLAVSGADLTLSGAQVKNIFGDPSLL